MDQACRQSARAKDAAVSAGFKLLRVPTAGAFGSAASPASIIFEYHVLLIIVPAAFR
jgi:hypothetical protein